MKVLLINTHHRYPGWSEGGLNASLQEVARRFFQERGGHVVETVVDKGYDPQEEERKHREADLVILQTPVNWFSAPWTWKKYVDEVFNVALGAGTLLSGDGRTRKDPSIPYGSGGNMQGRAFMVSSTWNAPADAFDNDSNPVFQGRSLADALADITATYRFCGYTVLPEFAVLDVYKNPQVEADLARYAEHLEACATRWE
ncbi:flavodoxin [Actinomyces sp. 2119]|uniref:Flavodoxin n=1 Tax=Actinomyces lilanjuaniae TaxID=2321394 RepID=A0ABM6Z5C9_9ACTO|nr:MULTISPECIES: NAD(P)H-dependent oxidoreductase [Actinomyces]AYD90350.1 flavodoxin [Actinomyces lilanjuaniae]RJF40924.1 flavodoxin [Actinomyces sp. 2119]